MASRIVARSTMQGTPVKSCMMTRAGVNWISVSGSACGSQLARARMCPSVMLAPSSVRSRFSSSTLRLKGRLAAPGTARSTGASRKTSYVVSPTSSVPLAPKLSLLVPWLTGRSSRRGVPAWVPSAVILPQAPTGRDARFRYPRRGARSELSRHQDICLSVASTRVTPRPCRTYGASGTSVATHSTWCVIGNRSKARTPASR